MLLELFPFVILNDAMAFVYPYKQCLELLLTVTLRGGGGGGGVSNKHCLLPLFRCLSLTLLENL